MKIESMDATFKPAVNLTPLDGKTDMAAKQKSTGDENAAMQDKVSEAFIQKAIGKANETMKIQNRSLEFRIHEKTHEIIVKIIDTDTKEVIREIPSEKILDMFANMLELAGLLVDERR